jgi:hypothetical protein
MVPGAGDDGYSIRWTTEDSMTAEIGRWRDIVLAPCNQTAARRNWAATKEALQALAEQPPAEAAEPVAGADLRFFEVLTSNIGGDSCQVKEVVFNAGTLEWEATGAEFEAWDWTPDGAFKQNFVEGFVGIGRLNETIGDTALEVMAIEGYARFIEGTATGAMAGQTVSVTIDEFWGDPLNGRSPGASTTVHDVTNQAPNLANGDKVLAALDEKRQLYVLLAPYKGSQPPGTSAIVQIKSGPGGECNTSVSKDGFCLYSAVKTELSAQALIDEEFCAEKFQDGQQVWVLDARNCRTVDRLQHMERYVAVSMLDEFSPGGSSPRPLYAVVDASPPLRWFRILNNAEAIAQDGTPNDLKCRDCDDDDVLDDSPSVWGKWEDRNPCEFDKAVVPDPEPQLLYFPFHAIRCLSVEEQIIEGFDECWDNDVDPYCRNEELILGFWNPIAERWEAITDIQKCIQANGVEVAHIMICNNEYKEPCCLYDAVKLVYSPRNDSYCAPKTKRSRVWARCANGYTGFLPVGYCRLGVKICNQFLCDGERRPVFMFDCGNCAPCVCPDPCDIMTFTLSTDNANDDCASLINGITGIMRCVDQIPVFDDPPPTTPEEYDAAKGWWGEFEVIGVKPRILYGCMADYNGLINQLIYIEISCGGQGVPPGTILGKYTDELDPISAPVTFKSGIFSCLPLTDEFGEQLYAVRTYQYGIWAQCGDLAGSITNVQIFWLKDPELRTGADVKTITPECDDECPGGLTGRQVATSSALWGDRGFTESSPCCANSHVYFALPFLFECSQILDDVPIIGMGVQPEGQTSCPDCGSGTHSFAGCPCINYNPGDVDCEQDVTPCQTITMFVQLEWTPATGEGGGV